jgi:hypothetical protein
LNLKNNHFFQNFNSFLLFLGLFSTFFLWDIKNIYFDLRVLIIICSLIFLIINFRSLDLMNHYIIGAILFILIHYFLNFIKRDLSFNYNVIIFAFYLLISFYFLNFNKQKFTNIFPKLSKFFLIFSFFFIILNLKNFTATEISQSGSCSLFTNFSEFKFRHFMENSHFGMVAPAAIFCFLFSIKKKEFLKPSNILFYIIIITVCVFIFSMTLILGLLVGFIGLIFSVNKKNYLYFLIITFLCAITILLIPLRESCTSRLERLSLLENISFLESKKLFYAITKKKIDEEIIFFEKNKNKIKCSELIAVYDEIKKIDLKLKTLDEKINTNQSNIEKLKLSLDEIFSLQMQTKILNDEKDDLFLKLSNLILNTSYDNVRKICPSDFENYKNFSINNDYNVFYKTEKEKLNRKSINILASEEKYQSPNITTQVYQIALINTYKSIQENPLGWGYNNYQYSHFKYTLESMTKLNIKSDVDINFKNNKDIFNDLENLQDPDVFYLNYNDGRNNFSKLLTEFGYFAIALLIFLIIFSLSQRIKLTDKSFLIPLIATQLGSGAGYTNGGFALAIVITFIIYINQFRKPRQ